MPAAPRRLSTRPASRIRKRPRNSLSCPTSPGRWPSASLNSRRKASISLPSTPPPRKAARRPSSSTLPKPLQWQPLRPRRSLVLHVVLGSAGRRAFTPTSAVRDSPFRLLKKSPLNKTIGKAAGELMSTRLRKLCLLILLLFLSFLGSIPAGRALENGLALTPPMGWNSWNRFACSVNEDLVKSAADALVSSGMKDVGYEYVVIDDCWQVSRDPARNIFADAKTFPSGIKALADYVHSKGLNFGIYSDAGTMTCAKLPGTRAHEYLDALLYASWMGDYLNYDWFNTVTVKA